MLIKEHGCYNQFSNAANKIEVTIYIAFPHICSFQYLRGELTLLQILGYACTSLPLTIICFVHLHVALSLEEAHIKGLLGIFPNKLRPAELQSLQYLQTIP